MARIDRQQFDRERIKRVARIYRTTGDAARALDIRPSSFARLCRRFNIETPTERNQRKRGGGAQMA